MIGQEDHLRILQYNVHTSDKVLIELLADERVRELDILAIQEPWRNERGNWRGYNPSGGAFRLISTNTERTRAAIYLNRRLQNCEVLKVEDSLVTVSVEVKWREAIRKIIIHSAYNRPPGSYTTTHVPEQLQAILQAVEEYRDEDQLLVGDFNLHHPAWGGPNCNQHRLATDLIAGTGSHHLQQLLEPGTITRDQTKNAGTATETRERTTIDLAFSTENIRRRLISCKVREDLEKGSDHLPIVTVIKTNERVQQDPPRRRAWKRLNSTRFEQIWNEKTADLDAWDIGTKAEADEYTRRLLDGAKAAIEASTPWTRHSLRDKQFWTPMCTEMVLEASSLRWKAKNTGEPEDQRLARAATNKKGKVLRAAKRRAFRKAMAQASQRTNGLWKMAKWAAKSARNQLEQEYFPTLRTATTTATTAKDKAELLYKECFPAPPEVDLSDLEGYRYTGQLNDTPEAETEVTEEEQQAAIARLKPDKAPGDSGIPNQIVKVVAACTPKRLQKLYSACLRLGYHPEAFRRAVTVVLKKPGKSDYSSPGAYRPIALLETFGKVLEAIVAKRISKLAEKYLLLPDGQYGARPGRSTDTALLCIVEQVRAAWERDSKCVVSLLSMDVAKAFDRVSHPRLLHELRKNRIPETLVNWVSSFLRDRSTAIRLGEYTSQMRKAQVGIPQGSPSSPMLYLFYNACLIRSCEIPRLGTSAVAFVDDNNVLAIGKSTEATTRALGTIEERCRNWERTHGSKFNRDKFHLVHLAKSRRKDLSRPILLSGQRIEAEKHTRILGVQIDQKLTGQAHLRAMTTRAPEYEKVLRTLAGSTWGASLGATREVYLRAIRPAITFGALLWYRPEGILTAAKGMAAKLRAIQGQCLRAVTGAYKATATEALEVEIHVEPLELYTGRQAAQAAARCRLSKAWSGIEARTRKILKGRGIRGRTPKLFGPVQRLWAWTEGQIGKKLSRAKGTETEADQAAKQLLKEVKKRAKEQTMTQWRQKWADSAKGAHSKAIQPLPGEEVFRRLSQMPRAWSSLVIQLRTGKIGFRAFLYQRRVPGFEDPSCQDCDAGEDMTVAHVLLKCSKWQEQRNECFQRAGCSPETASLANLLNTRKGCLAAARMIWKTGLLKQFQACDLERAGDEDSEEESKDEPGN